MYEGRFKLSTTQAIEISIRDGSKFDDTEKFTNLDFIFNFVDIIFAIVRERSPPQRFSLSANVLEIKVESEPESNNAFARKVLSPFETFMDNTCKYVKLFCLSLS